MLISFSKRIRSKYTKNNFSLKNENTNDFFKESLNEFAAYSLYPDIKSIYAVTSVSLNVSEDNLIFGTGSEELLKNLFLLLNYNSIQILEHSYELAFYYNLLLNKRVIINHASYNEESFCFEDVESLGGDVLYLVSPHCPTAVQFSSAQIEAYSKKFKYVIVDEAYVNPTVFDKRILPNVIYVRSFSKLGGVPGLRIGYAVAHNDIIQRLHTIRNSYEINSHAVEYLKFIFDHKLLIEQNIKEYEKCYILLKQRINNFSVHCANFATFKSQNLHGKIYKIGENEFTRVTLTDSKNYENLYCG
jgi:histidinol-phosphate aminotransferase